MRALTNEVELQTWLQLPRIGTSRGFGTASTTPFATNTNEVAQLQQDSGR